jgi:hypothetical protein
MPEKLTSIQKLDTIGNLLDKLTDAQGRAKCGYIYIINEFVNELRNEVLVMEEKLKDLEHKEDEETETPSP